MTELPRFARFWMVCRKPTGPHSKTEPRQRYSRIEDARADARTLAEQTGAAFLILEAVEIERGTDAEQGHLL